MKLFLIWTFVLQVTMNVLPGDRKNLPGVKTNHFRTALARFQREARPPFAGYHYVRLESQTKRPSLKSQLTRIECAQALGFPTEESCKNACFKNASVNIKGKKAFKIVWLNPFDPSSQLGTQTVDKFISRNMTTPVHTQRNDSHGICYSFSMRFFVCNKLALDLSKASYINSTHTLAIDGVEKQIDSDEFYKFRAKKKSYYLVCKEDAKKPNTSVQMTKKLLELVASSISLTSLIIAIFLNVFLKNMTTRQNQLLQNHIIMMTLGFAALTFQLSGINKVYSICDITILLQNYFFVSAFCWMNAQSLDLCLSLRGCNAVNDNKNKPKRYVYYSLFSNVLPAIISAAILMMQMIGSNQSEGNIEYQDTYRYWSHFAKLFQYGWMAASLMFNLITFAIIVFMFHRLGKTVSRINEGIHTQLLKVCIKLVFAMGFSWIFKIISYFHQHLTEQTEDQKPWLLYFSAVSNLTGFFVLLVYFFNRRFLYRTVCQCCKKLPQRKKKISTTSNTELTAASSSELYGTPSEFCSNTGCENPAVSISTENSLKSSSAQHMS